MGTGEGGTFASRGYARKRRERERERGEREERERATERPRANGAATAFRTGRKGIEG